jgi:hypothetical protein
VRVRAAAARPAAAVVAAAVVGCGGVADQQHTRTQRSAPAPPPSQITIEEPVDGQALRGREEGEEDDGSLRLRARVRGRARPGSTVFLNASCVPVPCEAQAFARANGGWSTTLDLTTPGAGGFIAIDVNAQKGVVASGSAVATVELVSASTARDALGHDAEQARAAPDPEPPSKPPELPREALVVGDSLAIGMARALKAALPGWQVRVDAQIGRPLEEGMQVLGRQSYTPAVLALSLFTNDDPRNTGALESAVRATATRAGGCAVWATIVAPPVKNVEYTEANQLLRTLAADPALAPRLRVVDWSTAVARKPGLLALDGVHATTAGYRTRGRLFADAIKACAGDG